MHAHVEGVVDRNRVRLQELISGVPPFGHDTKLRVFIDPDLLEYGELWAAAGTWNDNFAISPSDLVRVSAGTVVELKR